MIIDPYDHDHRRAMEETDEQFRGLKTALDRWEDEHRHNPGEAYARLSRAIDRLAAQKRRDEYRRRLAELDSKLGQLERQLWVSIAVLAFIVLAGLLSFLLR